MVLLGTRSGNHATEIELCLKVCLWAESFGIFSGGVSRRLQLRAWSGAGLFQGLIPTSNRNTQSSAVICSSFAFSPTTANRATASALSTESARAQSRCRFKRHRSSKVIGVLLL